MKLGKFSGPAVARAALLSAMMRDGGWWGEPMLARWGKARGVSLDAARDLMLGLVEKQSVEHASRNNCCRWRAKV